MERLKFGKANLIFGWLLVVLFFLLGWYLDAKMKTGSFSESIRHYLRRAHTHGLAFATLNLLIGLCVDLSGLGRGAKQAASLLGILGSFLFPTGLLLYACNMVSAAAMLMHTGGLLMAIATLLLLIGFITLPKQSTS